MGKSKKIWNISDEEANAPLKNEQKVTSIPELQKEDIEELPDRKYKTKLA